MNVFRKLLIASFTLATVTAFAQDKNFVGSKDGNFVLNGQPFKFVGTNNYYLHYKNNTAIDDVFKQANDMGVKVIRMWAFGDGEKTKAQNNFSIQPKMGDFTTRNGEVDGLERIDYSIAQAQKNGIKLILVLTNYWEDFGGMEGIMGILVRQYFLKYQQILDNKYSFVKIVGDLAEKKNKLIYHKNMSR